MLSPQPTPLSPPGGPVVGRVMPQRALPKSLGPSHAPPKSLAPPPTILLLPKGKDPLLGSHLTGIKDSKRVYDASIRGYHITLDAGLRSDAAITVGVPEYLTPLAYETSSPSASASTTSRRPPGSSPPTAPPSGPLSSSSIPAPLLYLQLRLPPGPLPDSDLSLSHLSITMGVACSSSSGSSSPAGPTLPGSPPPGPPLARRVVLSTAYRSPHITSLHVQLPLGGCLAEDAEWAQQASLPRGVWCSVVVDVHDICATAWPPGGASPAAVAAMRNNPTAFRLTSVTLRGAVDVRAVALLHRSPAAATGAAAAAPSTTPTTTGGGALLQGTGVATPMQCLLGVTDPLCFPEKSLARILSLGAVISGEHLLLKKLQGRPSINALLERKSSKGLLAAAAAVKGGGGGDGGGGGGGGGGSPVEVVALERRAAVARLQRLKQQLSPEKGPREAEVAGEGEKEEKEEEEEEEEEEKKAVQAEGVEVTSPPTLLDTTTTNVTASLAAAAACAPGQDTSTFSSSVACTINDGVKGAPGTPTPRSPLTALLSRDAHRRDTVRRILSSPQTASALATAISNSPATAALFLSATNPSYNPPSRLPLLRAYQNQQAGAGGGMSLALPSTPSSSSSFVTTFSSEGVQAAAPSTPSDSFSGVPSSSPAPPPSYSASEQQQQQEDGGGGEGEESEASDIHPGGEDGEVGEERFLWEALEGFTSSSMLQTGSSTSLGLDGGFSITKGGDVFVREGGRKGQEDEGVELEAPPANTASIHTSVPSNPPPPPPHLVHAPLTSPQKVVQSTAAAAAGGRGGIKGRLLFNSPSPQSKRVQAPAASPGTAAGAAAATPSSSFSVHRVGPFTTPPSHRSFSYSASKHVVVASAAVGGGVGEVARALLFSDGEKEEENEDGEVEEEEEKEKEVEVRVPTPQKRVDAPPPTAPTVGGGGKGLSWLEGHMDKYGMLDTLLDEILKGATR